MSQNILNPGAANLVQTGNQPGMVEGISALVLRPEHRWSHDLRKQPHPSAMRGKRTAEPAAMRTRRRRRCCVSGSIDRAALRGSPFYRGSRVTPAAGALPAALWAALVVRHSISA